MYHFKFNYIYIQYKVYFLLIKLNKLMKKKIIGLSRLKDDKFRGGAGKVEFLL